MAGPRINVGIQVKSSIVVSHQETTSLNQAIEKEIISQLSKLPPEKQQEVLHFVRTLTTDKPVGIPGRNLLNFAGSIEASDLAVMTSVIEKDCEQVNLNEW